LALAFILGFIIILSGCYKPPVFDEIVDPPELLSPENNAVLFTPNPLLEWTSTEYADNYIITINNVAVASITDLSYEPELNSGTYTWSITAQNYFQYVASTQREFTIRLQPAEPILIAPTSTQDIATPKLEWMSAENATTYQVDISTTSDFAQILHTSNGITETSFTTPSLDDGEYYWKVTAFDDTGLYTESQVFYLRIDTSSVSGELLPPILLTPTITQDTSTPTFTWQAGTDAVLHNIEIATDSTDFSNSIVVSDSTLTGTDTTFVPASGFADGTYFWRVVSTDTKGDTHTSPIWQLLINTTTPSGIVPPSVLSPTVSLCTDKPVFEWSAATGASIDHYHIEIATDSADIPGTLVQEDSTLTSTTYAASILSNGTYYWRVTAHFVSGTPAAESSNIYSIIVFKIDTPVIVGITTGFMDPYPTFEWNSVSGATNYNLQISDDSFASIYYSKTEITETTFSLPLSEAALPKGNYEWRVNAENNMCSQGSWTTPEPFEIDPKFFVGGSAGLFYSVDGGATFQKHTGAPGSPPEAKIMDIMVHNDDVWLIYDTSGVWKSVDRGVTYTQQATYPLSNGYSICQFNNQIYAASGAGSDRPYYSDDGGATWNQVTGINIIRRVYGCYSDASRDILFLSGNDTQSGMKYPRGFAIDTSPYTNVDGDDDYRCSSVDTLSSGYSVLSSTSGVLYIGATWALYGVNISSLPCDDCFSYVYGNGGSTNHATFDIREGTGGVWAATQTGFKHVEGFSVTDTSITASTEAIGFHAGKIWVGKRTASTGALVWTDDLGTTNTEIVLPESTSINAIQHLDLDN